MFTTQDLKSCMEDLAAIFLILKWKTHKTLTSLDWEECLCGSWERIVEQLQNFPISVFVLTAENGAYVG